jgi:hypothetical protein
MARKLQPEKRAEAIAGLAPRLVEPLRTEALKVALDKEALDNIAEIGNTRYYVGDWGFVLNGCLLTCPKNCSGTPWQLPNELALTDGDSHWHRCFCA